MNVGSLKPAEQRVVSPYLSRLKLKAFGRSNLYPQEVRNIVLASPNGRNCYERRATYIEGNGFRSQLLSDAVCSRNGDKVDDILAKCAADVAMYDGVCLHFNYNVFGEITSMAHIPFEDARLEEPGEDGVIRHVVVHPDWTGTSTVAGQKLKVDDDTVERFPVFNPTPEVVIRQIEEAGGIELYNGQVLYITRTGRMEYTTPIFDASLTDMSTDEGLANVNNRNVRNNFLAGGMLFVTRGTLGQTDDEEFFEQIQRLQGDQNACKIAVVVGSTEEDKPQFVPFNSSNFDKEFTETTSAVVANIYASFNQDMFYRLRNGSIGFSGQIATEVKLEYCEQVRKNQRMLSRIFYTAFEHWTTAYPLPYKARADVEIEPLYTAIDNAATI